MTIIRLSLSSLNEVLTEGNEYDHTNITLCEFLSPALFPTYEWIIGAIAPSTGIPISLETGMALEDLVEGKLAGGFICGLLYVHRSRCAQAAVELSAAPLLLGARY